VLRIGIIDISGIVNIIDIVDITIGIADISTDITDIIDIGIDIMDIGIDCGYYKHYKYYRLDVANIVVETGRRV
jgi:hypothetical protein